MDIDKAIDFFIKNIRTNCNRSNNAFLIDYYQMIDILRTEPNVILLDVRSVQEYNEGHLNGAINIPLYDLKTNAKYILGNLTNTIITYCQVGVRSIKACNILRQMGYQNVYSLEGGLDNNF